MASKGQKFKKHDNKIKEEIICKLQSGTSSYYLSEKYGIPSRTIQSWKRKFINHPELFPNAGMGSGRPKEKDLTKEDYKERKKKIKKYQAFLKAQREKK